ncbi:MAG: B12-binding domain-containing radical SAM protein [Myxococcota bacterium]
MSPHVILVVPGEEVPSPLRLEDKFPFPLENLGVAYLAASLERAGFCASIVDGYAARWNVRQTAERVCALLGEKTVLGISVLQATAEQARKLARLVRAKGFAGPIVLGGWAATMSAAELLAFVPDSDLAVRGEAEDVFPVVVAALLAGETPSVQGVVLREGAGVKLCGEPPRARFEGALLRHDAFAVQGLARRGSFPVQGSRGCAWGLCSFCSTAGRYGAKAWRMRGVDSLLEELAHPAVAHDRHPVFFVDDEFFGPCEEGFARADALAERLCSERRSLEFGLDCLVQSFEPRRFERLREAGLRRVFLGLESGSQASLKIFRKGFSVTRAREVLASLAQLGIDVISGYILFQPYMSLADVRTGVDFLADDLAHDGNPGKFLSRLHPEAGTELFGRLQRDGLLTGSFPDWGFRFADPRVGKLYGALEAETAELCAEYVRRRVAMEGPTRSLTQDFLRRFESHWQRAGE